MPSLLEQIGQKRYDQGVTVYSPTRQLVRPQGGMANAGTAQQIISGGAPSGGGYTPSAPSPTSFRGAGPQLGPTSSGPQVGAGPQLGGPPAPPMTTLDQMLAQSRATAQQAQVEEPSGFAGVIGTVVNNPISRAVMAPLQVLDMPRRAVMSTVQEVADAMNGGDASFSDWSEQFGDESFGFGDVVGDTGNIWADRFIGLAGDILLDPLTYVGGSAILAGAGRGARVGAAARSVAHGFSDEITQGLGRLGYSSVNADKRAAMRLAGEAIHDPGYRFRIPGIMKPAKMVDGELVGGGVRIPGTGGMEQGVSKFFAGMRAGINEKVPGMSRLRHWRSTEGLEEATEKLITGRGAMPLVEAAEIVNFTNAKNMAKRTVQSRLNQEGQQLMSEYSDNELTAMIDQAETAGGTAVNKFYDSAHDMAREYGVDFAGRKNYVPHFLTEDAWNWVNGKTPDAVAFRQAFDLGDEINNVSPVLLERKLVGRDTPYVINGKEFNVKTGTIKEWNEEFARVMPDVGAKFFDDNFSTILSRYALGLSDDAGIVRAVKHLLQSKSGVVKGFNDNGALREVVDEALTKHANELTAKQLRAELQSASDIVKKIKDDTMKGVSGIQGLLGVQLRGAVDEMSTLADDTKLAFGQALVEAEMLADRVGAGPYTPALEAGPRVAPPGPGPRALEQQAAANRSAVPFSVVPPSRRGGRPEQLGPGQLERQFDVAMTELDTKIDNIDVQMAKVSVRAAAEQGLFKDAARGARVNRLTMKNMGKATAKWNELVATRTMLANDRETLRAIGDRLELNYLKSNIVARDIEDPHFLSLAAGRDVQRKVAPAAGEIRTAEGAYRVVGEPTPLIWQGSVAHTTASPTDIRRDFQRRREEILGKTPELQDMSAEITVQENTVARVEQDRDRIAAIHHEGIQSARGALVTQRDQEAVLRSRVDQLDSPGLADAHESAKNALKAHRQGALREAQEAYEVAQRPLAEANANVRFQQKMLDAMKRRQEEVARGSPVGGKALPAASTPTGPPQLEDLPYTPQHLGQVRKSIQRDRNVVRQWERGPEAQQVRQAAHDRELVLRERQEIEAEVKRLFGDEGSFVSPDRAPFTIDRDGNITHNIDATDRVGLGIIRERDDAAQLLKQAQNEVDRIEARLWGGVTDDPTEYNAAIKTRDRQAEIVRKYDNNIIREGLDRYRGTAMEARLRRAKALKEDFDRLNQILRRSHEHSTRLQRKIAPVRRRLEGNQGLLDEQAAAIARNEELLNPKVRPVPKEVSLDEKIAKLNKQEAEALNLARARSNQAGYRYEWEPVPEVTGRELAVHGSESAEFFEGRRMSLSPEDEQQLVDAYEVLRATKRRRGRGGHDAEVVRRARTTIQEIEGRRGPGWTSKQLAIKDEVEESLAAVQRIQNSREIFPEAALGDVGKEAIRKTHRVVPKSNRLSDRASVARQEMDRAKEVADDLMISEAILPEDYWKPKPDGGWTKDVQPGSFQRVYEELEQQYRIYSGSLIDDAGEPLIDPLTGDRFRPNPSRQVSARLEQAVSEANRQAEFMFRLKAVVDSGATPSDSLSALVLLRTLDDEYEALRKSMTTTEKLLQGGFEKRIAKYEASIAKHTNKIEEQQTILARIDQTRAETGIDDPAARRKAQQIMGDQARQIRELKHPDTGFVDAEVEAMTQFLEGQVNDIHMANERLKDVRWMRDRVEWPHQQRALLEASVPHWSAVVEEQKWSLRNRRMAIDRARAQGKGTVTFVPFEQNKMIVLSLEDAKTRLAEIPTWRKQQRAELRGAIAKAEAAAKRLEAPGAKRLKRTVEEANFVKYTPFNDKPTTMTIAEAEADIEGIEAAIRSVETSLEADQIMLGVLDGTSKKELDELAQVLADVQQPPDRTVLQGRLERMQARHPEPNENQLANMNLLSARIHMIDNPATAEEVARWTQRRNQLVEAQDAVDEGMGHDRERLMAVIDSGQEFLTRIVNKDEPINRQEMVILRDLIGAEGAEVARQWISSLNAVLADRGRAATTFEDVGRALDRARTAMPAGPGTDRAIEQWTEKLYYSIHLPDETSREAVLAIVDEIQAATGGLGRRSEWFDELNEAISGGRRLSSDDVVEIVNELQEVVGDSPLSEFMARNVMEKVEGGSGATAERFKTEMLNAVVAAAIAERDNDLRNFAQMFRSMGLTVFTGRSKEAVQKELDALLGSITGMPTKSQNQAIERLQQELGAPGTPYSEKTPLQAMGFRMGKGTLDRRQLKNFVIQQYQAQGFDPRSSLQDRLMTLELRANRIKTMQRGLGLGLSMSRLENPEQFFRRAWGEADPSVIRPRPPEQDVQEVLALSKELDAAEARTAAEAEVKPAVVTPPPPKVMSARSQEEIEAEVMELMDQLDPENPEQMARFDQLQEELRGGPLDEIMPEGEPAPPLTPEPAAAPAAAPAPTVRWKSEGENLWRANDWTIHKQEDGNFYLIDAADNEVGQFPSKRAAQAAYKQQVGGAPPTAAALPAVVEAPPPPESLLPAKLEEVNAKLKLLHDKRNGGAELTHAENTTMASLYDEMEEIELELADVGELPEMLARRHPDFVQGESFETQEFLDEAAQMNMSRSAYAEYQAYGQRQAHVESGRTNRIAYNWRTIMKEGTPNHNVARRLKKSHTGFEGRARSMSGANVRPSGAFTKNLLESQERRAARPARAILDAQENLRQMNVRTQQALEAGRLRRTRLRSRSSRTRRLSLG